MTDIAFTRGTKTWIKCGTGGGGSCFLVTWDNLERAFRGESIKKVLASRLKKNEYVERYSISNAGVTVYVGRNEA